MWHQGLLKWEAALKVHQWCAIQQGVAVMPHTHLHTRREEVQTREQAGKTSHLGRCVLVNGGEGSCWLLCAMYQATSGRELQSSRMMLFLFATQECCLSAGRAPQCLQQ